MKEMTTACPHCQVLPHLKMEKRVVSVGFEKVSIQDAWLECLECGEKFYTQGLAARRDRLARKALRAGSAHKEKMRRQGAPARGRWKGHPHID